ncbi:MAG: hypothetical protein QOE55_7181 [Acidobacteriaceae bacterium]|nr:hypothetical protein [Acidobacteriaceae bacterium]
MSRLYRRRLPLPKGATGTLCFSAGIGNNVASSLRSHAHMLEEEGFATVSSTEGSKKLYAATEQGIEYLKESKVVLKAIFGRDGASGQSLWAG